MLLQIPVELQTEIISLLPRKDLASVVRVSQHLNKIAIRMLLAHVHLKTFDQLEAFFSVQGSSATNQNAETKRSQWESMKSLDITIPWQHRKRSIGILPRSLRGREMEPLRLDRLRITYQENIESILPLLRCLDPLEFGIHRLAWTGDHAFDKWTAATGWKNVTRLTVARDLTWGQERFVRPGAVNVLSNVTSATLILRNDFVYGPDLNNVAAHASLFVRFCPGIDHIKILTVGSDASGFDQVGRVKRYLQNGIQGKPADFFAVDRMPTGADKWGTFQD